MMMIDDDRDELLAHLVDDGTISAEGSEMENDEQTMTDSQHEACVALLELLREADGECDRCDYCNCPLVTVVFTTPQQEVTHRHCLNCGSTLIGTMG